VIGFVLGHFADADALFDEGGEGVVFVEAFEGFVAVEEEGGVADGDPVEVFVADGCGDQGGAHGGAGDGEFLGEEGEGVVGGVEGEAEAPGGGDFVFVEGADEGVDGDVAGDGTAGVGAEAVTNGEEEAGECWLRRGGGVCEGVVVLLGFPAATDLAGGEVLLLDERGGGSGSGRGGGQGRRGESGELLAERRGAEKRRGRGETGGRRGGVFFRGVPG
jgi:hypothetical protein